MKKEEFLSWHTEFIKRFAKSSYANYHPKDMSEWYDSVVTAHEDLRSMLGGVKLEATIPVAESDGTLKWEQCSALTRGIIRLLPEYLRTYGFYEETLCHPQVKHSTRTFATSKHIMGYADRIKLSGDKLKELSNLVAKLGEMWTQAKSKKITLSVTISTDPVAFCNIGAYKVDSSSCFVQGGMNGDKKYAFGTHPYSFVVLISNDPIKNIDVDSSKYSRIIARKLGALTHKKKVFNTFNTNWNTSDKLSSIKQAITEVAKMVCGFENPIAHDDKVALDGGINYIGGYRWSVANKGTIVGTQIVTLTTKYSREMRGLNRDPHANWDIKD